MSARAAPFVHLRQLHQTAPPDSLASSLLCALASPSAQRQATMVRTFLEAVPESWVSLRSKKATSPGFRKEAVVGEPGKSHETVAPRYGRRNAFKKEHPSPAAHTSRAIHMLYNTGKKSRIGASKRGCGKDYS